MSTVIVRLVRTVQNNYFISCLNYLIHKNKYFVNKTLVRIIVLVVAMIVEAERLVRLAVTSANWPPGCETVINQLFDSLG